MVAHLALSSTSSRQPVTGIGLSLLPVIVIALACGGGATPTPDPLDHGIATLTLTSPAFEAGEAIPIEYTCDGDNHSPPLEWGDVPQGTESLALIVDDPDARGFIHWVVYSMDADQTDIAKGLKYEAEIPDGGTQGINNFGDTGYGGPCPPRGDTAHTYRFSLYAVDRLIDLEPGASATEVLAAIRGHVLGAGFLEGTYARQ